MKTTGKVFAILAFVASLAAAGYMATAESWGLSSGASVSIDSTGRTVATEWTDRPERNLDNERVMKVWGAVLAGVSSIALVGALTGLTALVWAVGAFLAVMTFLGMWSIGFLFAGPALLFLLAAFFLTLGRSVPAARS